MPIEMAMRLAHFQQAQQAGPTMPRAAQAIFDSVNQTYRRTGRPPAAGPVESHSRVQPRNGGMPPKTAPASAYGDFMRRKHPKPAAVIAKRSEEAIPRAGASPQEFENWLTRNRPGLAASAAHAPRVVNLRLKVVTQ